MKNRMNIWVLISLLWVALSNCVDEFNAKLPEDSVGLLVVDGNIISDSTVTFLLSRTFSLNEPTAPEGYDQIAADVSVVGDDGSRIAGVSMGKGRYQVRIGTLDKQVRYGLEVVYDGDTYTSEPQYPLETAGIADVTFAQPEDYGDIYINLSTESAGSGEPAYYIWTYEEDWEVRAAFAAKSFYNPQTKEVDTFKEAPYARGWMHAETSKTIIGSTEANAENRLKDKRMYSFTSHNLRASFYYSTLMKQRALSKGEFEYYENKAKLSEGMGGLFTPQPSELPTNITCSDPEKRVIGYVGVNMNISEYRFYVSTYDLQYENLRDCNLLEDEEIAGKSMDDLYTAGYRIAFAENLSGNLVVFWTRMGCTDVRDMGASLEKPSFWPL